MSDYFKTDDDKNYLLKAKQMDIESGLLGKLFGARNNAPLNIAGLVAIFLLLPAVAYTCWNINSQNSSGVLEFWKIISPLVGMVLGYIFGRKDQA